ncbi:hypothetical protein PRIC1_002212 [Phytophthora ramorum]|uniref:Extracellular protease inhibitor 10 n=1 Tax=Phytophthora ramorum TaxID=164328 RepID=UPI0030AD8E8A|nr:Extracellular protease inhibitor 10 [Phytophthora ramorum]KAH7509891.1 Extracellular protease inhibitor 10 [Phytophthora ramorum]
MKTGHLVLAAIAVASAHADYTVQQSTAASNSSDCSYACPDVYVPVCGSDGVTYPNECSLNLENCESQEQVTQVSDGECPATGSTSQTSSYEGSGATACSEVCLMIYQPVCGSDGVTYGNDCILGIAQCKSGGAITQVSDGQCPSSSTSSSGSATTGCPEVCIEIYKPVCGSDGVTYANSCFLGIAACKNPSITQASDGACVASEGSYGTNSDSVSSSEEGSTYGDGSSAASGCPDVCYTLYAPVCGSDGVTYGNECELEVASCNHPELHITKVSDKACSAACTTQF